VLGIPKPANQKALRKRLQEKAEHCRTVLRELPMCQLLDDEAFEAEHSCSAELLHSEELTCLRKFVETKDETGAYENEEC
jgi:hypothetical protein